MKSRILRGTTAIAIGALALSLGGVANAGQGSAVVESKSESEVVMAGATFRVSESTVIESKDGNKIALGDLPTTGEGASADDAAVWYEASDDEQSPTLHRLKLTGAVPD